MEAHPTTNRDVLIAVDVQNDFITGSLAVTEGAEVIAPINELAETIRANDGTVIFTRDWHPETTPHFDTWPVHCVAEADGAAFAPTLDIQTTDIVLSKGMGQTDGYSGWEGVGENGETLESLIEPRTPHEQVRVFLGGLATDYCVKATGIDVAEFFAKDERVTLYLLRDAVRAVALEKAHEADALAKLEAARFVAITTNEAREIIEGIL
jgi:nicotinamidase/pyrazinamidase